MAANAFNPSRLKNARLYRGMTITELAEKVSVTKQMISQYENGKSRPSMDTMFKIMSTLKFPKDFFYKEDFNSKIENTFFRANTTASKKVLKIQEIHSMLVSEVYDYLAKFVDFPPLNIPRNLSSDPEVAAYELREYWKLSIDPIKNIIYTLEQNGIIVASFKSEQLKVDAYCQHQILNDNDRFIMVLTNDKNSFARRQFNAAHELGHICLHKENLIVDELSPEEFSTMEKEANQFAAAFLLPKESFLADLHFPIDLDYYVELKKKWKVSISMMVVRAYNLGVINYNQYQNLNRKISSRGWRQKEPLDNIFLMKKPQAINKALELVIYNDVISGPQLVNELGYTKSDLEKILDLDSDVLSYSNYREENLVSLSKPNNFKLSN
ncbi:helix-turn-helix domain-containing protein [Pseudobacillus sp. 179-B 2D1 NHS]|uniref:helix-turn-helix domain-containing protein n=1 Tax=Pseudobacillus sp. 179-B 2D1 NHS TaxID=3374292 RepID=UPI003879808F